MSKEADAETMKKMFAGSCEVRQQYIRKWKTVLLSRRQRLGVSATQQRDTNPGTIRVMQRNLLADGLSQDGFLCNPITASWPCARDCVPVNGGDPVKLTEQLSAMEEAVAKYGHDKEQLIAALGKVKEKFDTEESQKNSLAVVDWQTRWAKVLLEIAAAEPDVVTMQELDMLHEVKEDLAKLGYHCALLKPVEKDPKLPVAGEAPAFRSNQMDYSPAYKVEGLEKKKTGKWLSHVASTGVAFAPKVGSNARKIKSKRKAEVDALKAKGLDADDDGVAIFWKAGRFEPVAISYLQYGAGNGKTEGESANGAVAVKLRERFASGGVGAAGAAAAAAASSSRRTVLIASAHLTSGDEPKKEKERLGEVAGPGVSVTIKQDFNGDKGISPEDPEYSAEEGGLSSWFKRLATAADVDVAILAMDANSRPQIAPVDGRNVWSVFHEAGFTSVWDEYFTAKGDEREGVSAPVTVNKMRGPGSAQIKKIGKHAYELIDHVYMHGCEMLGFTPGYEPVVYESQNAARLSLIPSGEVPSDHFAVCVDVVPSS